MFLICIFSISTLFIAVFFYASLLVQVIHQQDLKPWAFQGIFLPKFQVRFSICCLGDVAHLLRWFQPAPQRCSSGGSCSCLMVRRDFPTWRSPRLKHSSVPAQQGLSKPRCSGGAIPGCSQGAIPSHRSLCFLNSSTVKVLLYQSPLSSIPERKNACK